MKAFETTGIMKNSRHLVLDEPAPLVKEDRVRVIILSPEAELDETEGLKVAISNPAFEFLNDPAENIYTRGDGKPLDEEG